MTTIIWLAQQEFEVFALKRSDHAIVGRDDGVGQIAFALLKLQHFFFDRIARDESIREHSPRLSDAVRAVDRLRFDGGVPPRIEKENVIRRRQIQADAAGFQADEEQLAILIRLKSIDALLA